MNTTRVRTLEHSRTFLFVIYLFSIVTILASQSFNHFVELLVIASHVLCQLRYLTLPIGYGPSIRMAELKTSVTIVPLNGTNYPTWKVQCHMALVHDKLWGIVSGTETEPTEGGDRRSNSLLDKTVGTIPT